MMTPDLALQRLMEGNERYVRHESEHPNRDAETRGALAVRQTPFGIILSCADSRVPPEIIFDQGLGDLFVVRIAGNVVGQLGLESLEFGADYLGASLILVMGHENCGAVSAVLHGETRDIPAIASLIEPAIKKNKKRDNTSRLESAIKANVLNVVNELKQNPILADLISQGKLKIVGGYYQLESGAVSLLTEKPL